MSLLIIIYALKHPETNLIYTDCSDTPTNFTIGDKVAHNVNSNYRLYTASPAPNLLAPPSPHQQLLHEAWLFFAQEQ